MLNPYGSSISVIDCHGRKNEASAGWPTHQKQPLRLRRPGVRGLPHLFGGIRRSINPPSPRRRFYFSYYLPVINLIANGTK